MADNNLRPTARVARGATYLFVQGFATAIIGLVYFVFLAHTLEQWQMGAYALLSFVLSLAQVFGVLALQSAATKYIAQHQAQGEMPEAKMVAVRVLRIGMLTSAVTFLTLFIPAEWLSTMLLSTPEHALLIRIVALCSVFAILFMLSSGILQGLQRMRDVALLGLSMSVIHSAVGIALLLLGLRLYAVVIGWLAGWAIAGAGGLVLTYRHLGISGKPYPARPLLSYSFPLYVSAGIGLFVTWADQLLLVSYMSLLHGATEAQRILGIYYVAIRASVVPNLLSTSIVTALFPSLSGLYARQGAGGLKDAFRLSTRYSVLVGFPLIAGLATLAYPVIIIFGGLQYIDAAQPLVIISVGLLISTLGLAMSPILMTLNRTALVSFISVVGVCISLLFSYVAVVPLNLGMNGAALARALTTITVLLLTTYVVMRHVEISFDKESIWKALAASAMLVSAIIGLDLVRMLLSPSSYEFLVIRLHLLPIYVIAGALAYLGGLILLKTIKSQDVEILQEYLPQRLRWIASWLGRFVSTK